MGGLDEQLKAKAANFCRSFKPLFFALSLQSSSNYTTCNTRYLQERKALKENHPKSPVKKPVGQS
jgi:hypothetical protein